MYALLSIWFSDSMCFWFVKFHFTRKCEKMPSIENEWASIKYQIIVWWFALRQWVKQLCVDQLMIFESINRYWYDNFPWIIEPIIITILLVSLFQLISKINWSELLCLPRIYSTNQYCLINQSMIGMFLRICVIAQWKSFFYMLALHTKIPTKNFWVGGGDRFEEKTTATKKKK